MSQRIGLRHVSRTVKMPIPSGEQIVNGTFEAGTTGWVFTSALSNISTAYAHSPTHSVFSYSDGSGFYQTINNIKVEWIIELSFWCICPHGTGTMWVLVTYTDDTTTYIQYSHGAAWTKRDITSQLTSGKTIKQIKFGSLTDNPTYIDDASLIC